MIPFDTTFNRRNAFAGRDNVCNELKRRLHLARCARNKAEIRRLEKQLKWWGIPV